MKVGKHWLRLLCAGWLTVLGNGCSGNQSALNPAANQAGEIYRLWWIFCEVLCAIYLVVMAALVLALARKRRLQSTEPVTSPDVKAEHRLRVAVGSSTAVTIVILFVFLV